MNQGKTDPQSLDGICKTGGQRDVIDFVGNLLALRQSGWQQLWEIVRYQSEKTPLFGRNAVTEVDGCGQAHATRARRTAAGSMLSDLSDD